MRQFLMCLLLLPAAVTLATNDATQDRLSLSQAISNVLERNPALKAADYESRAAAARIRTATLTPALRASMEFENFGGSGILSGSDNLESTLSLSKVLELGDKKRLRGDMARGESLVLRNEQDAQRLDILAETAKRFIKVVSDQERLAISEHSLALAQRTHEIVELRVKAGRSANAELRRARIALAKMELELDHARHTLETSRLKLASLWGDTQVLFASAEADLLGVSRPAPFEDLAQLLNNNPDLVRFATQKRLSTTKIQLARARNKANIEVAGGLRHFNATDDTGFVVSLAVPFGSRKRAAPAIEEAEMLGLRDPYDFEQRRLELHGTLFEVHQEIIHATDAVTALRNTIIPLAEEALRDYQNGYTSGRYSLLELNVAQRTLLDSELELLIAATDYHRLRIEIDRLTGAGLATGDTP